MLIAFWMFVLLAMTGVVIIKAYYLITKFLEINAKTMMTLLMIILGLACFWLLFKLINTFDKI